MVQFKRSLLQLYAFAWSVGEQESKINVHHVALLVNEDVGIVPVFDLEHVADQRVSRQGVAEVLLRLLQVFALLI